MCSLQLCPKDVPIRIDLYDEAGIGGGASGVAGGLLHPYSPKGSNIMTLRCKSWPLNVANPLKLCQLNFSGKVLNVGLSA